ncbi:MAG: phage tail tape measure protein [Lachnospiraceae bacterium]|nr:phage tail tape measure protein [Lachnospiraceae bacterium]
MAERSVIREDVVSIGFEVEDNAFVGLTDGIQDIRAELGILSDTEAGLNDITREADLAQDAVGGLADSLRGPPEADGLAEPVRDVEDAAGLARGAVDDLTDEMADVGRQQLTDGVDQLISTLKHPLSSFKELAGKAKDFAKERLDAGVEKLPAPLQVAVKLTGSVLGKAKDLAGIGFQKTVSGMKSLASQAGKAAAALGSKAFSGVKALGKGVATGITIGSVALSGLATAGISVGAGFEASMSQVAATMGMTADEANYSNETYALLANTAKEMGASTKFSAAESAEALNYMALAGYDAEKSCAALPTVLNLAASGGMELAAASDMITDSMSALGIEATQDNLTEFGDKLAKTAQKSNTSVAQLGEAVLTVGGTAKSLAGGTTELNTLLGIIADNGVKGAEGGTALRNIMLSLQAPTDVAAKKMKKLGLNVYDAEGKMRPMNDILNDLNRSMDGMTDQKKQDALSTIFNKNDLKSVNALLANSGERYDELSGYINDSAGAMENMAKTMNENLTGRITEFKSAAEGAGIAFYEALGSSNLKGLVEEATGWVVDLTKATETDGLNGLVGQMGSTLSEAVTTVTGYLPSIIDSGAAITDSLIEGISQNQDTILDSITDAVFSLGGGVLQVMPKLLTVGMGLVTSLTQGMASNLPSLVPVAAEGIRVLKDGLMTYGPQLLATAGGLVGQLVNGLMASAPMITAEAAGLVVNLLNGLSQGFPSVLTVGINLIGCFLMGIAANAPQLLTAGVQMLVTLAQGIGQSLPGILESAGSIIGTLLQGLISGIPDIVKGAWEIVKALVGGILETDWLQVGKDIIGGIVSGVKSWFGEGKESGAEIGQSLAQGIQESAALPASAANTAVQGITSSLSNTDLYGSGQTMMLSLSTGMEAGGAAAANTAVQGFQTAFANTDLSPSGQAMAFSLASGLDSGTMNAVTSAEAASQAITNKIGETDLYGNGQMIFAGLSQGMDTGAVTVLASAGSASQEITAEIDKTNLYGSGQNIMQGLNSGMLSMQGTLNATARNIGSGISSNINRSLDIHSPSRVTEESGEYTGLGLIKGLREIGGKVGKEAKAIGETVSSSLSSALGIKGPGPADPGSAKPAAAAEPAFTFKNQPLAVNADILPAQRNSRSSVQEKVTFPEAIPFKQRYVPDSDSSTSNHYQSQEVNHYNPVFNLTLNGASASDSNERKVKRWVKDSFKECFEGIGRSRPKPQEV